MDFSEPIVALLLERPHWPNAAIARRVGCEQRRVRRYRRRVAECGVAPDDIAELDAISVRALLNARPMKGVPDFAALLMAHPGASGRTLWRAYVQTHPSDAVPLSYSQFMRLRAEWALENV